MSAILVIDGMRPFYAEAESVKTETRERGDVVSAAGTWTPDGPIVWASWHARRVEIRNTSPTTTTE